MKIVIADNVLNNRVFSQMSYFVQAKSETALSVTELCKAIRQNLEQNFGLIWVKGEISNLSVPSSGHAYFGLKDKDSQLRCAFFKNYQQKAHQLRNGMQVYVKAQVSLYEARGDCQLIVYSCTEDGLGSLAQEYLLRKQKFEAMGFFLASRKKPLPAFPERIAIVTSATGAAIRDIKITLLKRYPLADIILYPTEVQGIQAAPAIADAIDKANREAIADVLILGRGGGNIEDLWAFNEEAVLHAMHRSEIPIVTGIGHETDVTLADLTADMRAATPTAAAVCVSPDIHDLIERLRQNTLRLHAAMERPMLLKRVALQALIRHLTRPSYQISSTRIHLDRLEERCNNALLHHLVARQHQLGLLEQQLTAYHPLSHLRQQYDKWGELKKRLLAQTPLLLPKYKRPFQNLLVRLEALSPLATLGRGYAIVRQHKRIFTKSADFALDKPVQVILHEGELVCRIERITP